MPKNTYIPTMHIPHNIYILSIFHILISWYDSFFTHNVLYIPNMEVSIFEHILNSIVFLKFEKIWTYLWYFISYMSNFCANSDKSKRIQIEPLKLPYGGCIIGCISNSYISDIYEYIYILKIHDIELVFYN